MTTPANPRKQRLRKTKAELIEELEAVEGLLAEMEVAGAARQPAEEELARKEAQLRLAMDNMPGGILYVDRDLNNVLFNSQYWEMHGYSDDVLVVGANIRDELRYQTERGDYGPGDPDELIEEALVPFASSEPESYERTIPGGRTLQFNVAPTPDGGYVTICTDITDVVESQRGAKLLQEALDNFSDMLILYDKDERVVFTNDRYHEIYPNSPPKDEITNFTMEGLLRSSLEAGQIAHPLAKSDPEAWLQEALANRRNIGGAAGETTHESGRIYMFRHRRTTEGGMILTQTDITERKRAEEALAEKEAQLRVALDHMPGGMMVTDRDLNYVLFNSQYLEMQDFPEGLITAGGSMEDEVQYQADRGDFGGGDRDALIKFAFDNYMRGGSPVYKRTFPNGRTVQFQNASTPDGGRITIASDITEQERAEAEAVRRLAQLRATVDAMPDGILLLDNELNVITFNQLYHDHFEFSKKLAKDGESLARIFRFQAERGDFGDGDLDELVKERLELFSSGEPFNYERQLANGRFVEIRGNPVPEIGLVVSYTDITERKEAEEELAYQKTIADITLENMDQGISMIDGDLNVTVYNQKFLDLLEIPKDLMEAGSSLETLFRYNAERGEYGPGDIEDQVRERIELARKFEPHKFERERPDGTVIEIRGNPTEFGGFVTTYTDITERKRGEAALRESEEAFRAVVDQLPAAIVLKDAEGRFTIANKTFTEWYSKDGEDIVGKTSHDLYPKDLADKLRAVDLQVMKSGVIIQEETEGPFADGVVHTTLLSKFPILGTDGKAVAVGTVETDITERKQAEEALRESEQQFKTVLDHMPSAVYLRNLDGRYLLCNHGYEEIYGITNDMARGKTVHDIFSPEIAEEYAAEDRATIKGGQSVELEFFVQKNGEEIVLAGTKFPIFDLAGEVVGVGGVEFDITERKQAEEELRKQTERVNLLRKTATDANRATNFGEAIRTCLATVSVHTGWPVGHAYFLSDENDNVLVSSGIWHLDDPKRFDAFVEATKKTTFERGVGLPGRVLESGEPAWIIDVTKDPNFPRAKLAEDIGVHGSFAFPLIAGDKVVAVLEFFDDKADELDESLLATVANIGDQLGRVFERKQAEVALHAAKEEAEEATKAKATFLATMSHEIRTPMGGVIGMVDLLQQTKLTDDQRQMIDTVRDSAHSLLTIINDILDFSKIEAGKLDLEEIAISVRDIVEGAGEALAVNARNKGIGLSVYVDPDIPDALVGDQVRLRQILFNFGSNAIKFTEKGKVLIRADKVPSRSKKAITVQFRVIDEGIGIPEEAQKKLFQAFSQVETSTTRRFGGTGLGLSICQRLTEMMNGEIGVESAPGEGSTFSATITFPVAKEHTIKSDGHDLGGLIVLAAIGDDDMRELLPRYLKHWDATVSAIGEIENVKSLALKAAKAGEPFNVVYLNSAWPLAERISLVESLAAEKALSSARYVLACQGRARAERKEIDNTIYVDSDPLRRGALIKSIAVAAGRASPDVEYDESEGALDAGVAPTVAEAEAMGQLILLAEDNVTNQDVIRRQLTMLGYALEIANDGKEALELLGSRSFAILLTDCHMPNMDGFELTETIRKAEKGKDTRFPIVAITASVMKEDVDRCFAAGMDDCLAKPLEMKTLRETLHKLIPAPSGDVKAKVKKDNPAEDTTDTPEADDGRDGGDAPIDPSALKSVFGDDEATINEILKDFVEPATSNVGEIESSFAEHSADGVANAAHKLKSSARSVGANELADLCQTLELAGKAEDWNEIDKAVPRLPSTIKKVVEYIDNL